MAYIKRYRIERFIISDEVVYNLAKMTTTLLNDTQDLLRLVKWTDGESNIDTGYSTLACMLCQNAWNNIKENEPKYEFVDIACEAPDINIVFVNKENGSECNRKIELKSSKSTRMPGSTIKNLNINIPLIYCLRPKYEVGPFKVRCSQYYTAMGDSDIDLFQDRTPRPWINFAKMEQDTDYMEKQKDAWIDHYAICALKRLEVPCQKSWQDDMVVVLKEKIIKDFVKSTSIEGIKKMKDELLSSD